MIILSSGLSNIFEDVKPPVTNDKNGFETIKKSIRTIQNILMELTWLNV